MHASPGGAGEDTINYLCWFIITFQMMMQMIWLWQYNILMRDQCLHQSHIVLLVRLLKHKPLWRGSQWILSMYSTYYLTCSVFICSVVIPVSTGIPKNFANLVYLKIENGLIQMLTLEVYDEKEAEYVCRPFWHHYSLLVHLLIL